MNLSYHITDVFGFDSSSELSDKTILVRDIETETASSPNTSSEKFTQCKSEKEISVSC